MALIIIEITSWINLGLIETVRLPDEISESVRLFFWCGLYTAYIYKANNTIQNRSNMIIADKGYEKYIQKISNKLTDSSKKDPKENNLKLKLIYCIFFFKSLNSDDSEEENILNTENQSVNTKEKK